MMTSETDRNPSPPPELIQNDQHFLPDKVGDSVYSKQGVFQILMHIVESLGGNDVSNTRSPSKEGKDVNNLNCDIAELDSKVEDEACLLWDMSASLPVAALLHEYKASAILLDVIDKTNSPRLAEILIGILGNMVSFNDICVNLSGQKSFMINVVALSGASDAPTVIQVLRLIHTAVVNQNARKDWMDILSTESFFENMKFILLNSLNCDVLKLSLKLMYYIFDEDETICAVWQNDAYTKALLGCARQLMIMEDHSGLDEFWLVLNILCQYESNCKAFVENYDALSEIFHSYFMKFGDHEDVMPKTDRVISVAACFSTYGTIWKSGFLNPDFLNEELVLLGILHKMYVSLCEILSKPTKTECDKNNMEMNLSPSEEEKSEEVSGHSSQSKLALSEVQEEEHNNWNILLDAMRNAVISLSLYVDPEDTNGKLLLSLVNMSPTSLTCPAS